MVLYGCETWYRTLRDEYRLRVLEKRVPKRIFGRKRNKVTVGGGGDLHNEELRDLCSLPIIQFNSIFYYLCAESTATRPIRNMSLKRIK
jgi:hypothetical protein